MIAGCAQLQSVVLHCRAPDYREALAITSLVAMRHALELSEISVLPNCEAATVSDLKSYLSCRRLGCSVPPGLERLWETFYERCKSLVRRIIDQSCLRRQLSVDIDDLTQDVWHEVIVQLPKLDYDPVRGRLTDWLVGLVCKKLRRLLNGRLPRTTHFSIEQYDADLPSRELGPENECRLLEIQMQLEAGLERLHKVVSLENYDLFYWRFLFGLSYEEMADLSGLSVKSVRRRCERAMAKWRSLAKEGGLPHCADELQSASVAPLSNGSE